MKSAGIDIVERLAETKQANACLAGNGSDIPEEARELQAIMERCVSAEAQCAAAPQWRDKPTCAGLWAFPATSIATSWCCVLQENEIEAAMWQRPCFGPIPGRQRRDE